MKKFLSILLIGMLAFSLFACADTNKPQKEEPESKPMLYRCDTIIQDGNGVDKCFWEDGYARFDDYGGTGSQTKKSAILSLQTEYDMWIECDPSHHIWNLENNEDYYSIEKIYDKTKIDIKINPEKENHYIIKVLQPCEKEEVIIRATHKTAIPFISNLAFTISTES